MGQYYHAVCIDTGEWIYSHDHNTGSKLMEHSYLDNDFVGAAMSELAPGGRWHMKRFIWAGDYGEKKFSDFTNEIIDKFISELYPDENIYGACLDENKIIDAIPIKDPATKFLVNHTTEEYVDLIKIVPDAGGYRINPLPLLTADGNGQGGGDYTGTDMALVGSWCGDVISVEDEAPAAYEELVPVFTEE